VDGLEVDGSAGLKLRLVSGELNADEQVLDDSDDLLLVHEVEPAPPFLELENPVRPRSGAANRS
jgi:hypothetical protein